MAFKVLAICESCTEKCKQEVDERVFKGAKLIRCPANSKKNKTTKKKA